MTLPLLASQLAGGLAAGATDLSTERSLVLLGGWSVWMQVLVVAIGVLVLGLTLYNYRTLRPWTRRAPMLLLRVLVVALLLAVFYQPAVLEEHVARGRNLVVVLVDGSASMALPHGSVSRLSLAEVFLEEHQDLLESLGEDGDLVFHSFGGELGELGDLRRADLRLEPTARETRIVDALEAVHDRYRNHDMGAIILLTDAIDSSAHGRRARLDAPVQALVRDLDAPITSFVLPDDGRLKDVAVSDVAQGGFAFVMNVTTLDATLRVHGYRTGSIPVRLLENGRQVAETRVPLEPGVAEYAVSFEFLPRKLGKQVYAVVAAEQPGEVYAPNNVQQVVIKVLRDKVRVLQIVGQPSWDERFLRNHLKEDPSVDLISFFILINTHSSRPVGPMETSLIPFPAKELFVEELGGFDLAIFQNFNYGPFHTRQYLPLVADYVHEGGAFVLVGGPRSFASGGYYGTEITQRGVLPVEIPPGFEQRPLVDTEPFVARLSEAGHHHPITRLAMDPQVNDAVWRHLPALEGANLTSATREQAVVLVEHPTVKDDTGAPLPVVAVQEVGKGRSMAVTTDSTWQWSFVAGHQGGDPRHFDTFWSNAVRWLIRDPEMDLVRVQVNRERVPIGEEARARVLVFHPDYQPAAEESVGLVVRRRDEGAGAGEGEVVWRHEGSRTDGQGALDVLIPFQGAGIYEVEAKAHVVPTRVARGSDLFVATDVAPEMETVVGDGRLVALLAEASGGSVQSLTSEEPAITPRPPRISRVLSRKHDELWNQPWVLLALLALLGTEWWLRRRLGYL